MANFIARMSAKDIVLLGAVRCMKELQVAPDDEWIWIKLSSEDEKEKSLMQLPLVCTYTEDEQGNLFLPGALTPVEILKELNWQPLTSFLSVRLPVSALPVNEVAPVPIKIIQSEVHKPGSAILTQLSIWKTYAETAPAARLQLLRFAVSEKNEVLIIGNPLPPLPGTEYWIENGILIPAGYDFEIKLAATFINEQLNKNNENLVMMDSDGRYTVIAKSLFVPAKRSAVRLTNEIVQLRE